MKTDVHPKYFESAKITCSCGNVVVAGSTKETLKTELCSKCHPFFTGHQKLIDTAGRVDKFMAKKKKAEGMAEEKKARSESKKKKAEVYTEKVIPQEVIERAMSAVPKEEAEAPAKKPAAKKTKK